MGTGFERNFDINKALLACVRSSTYDTTGITPMMPASIVARIMPLELKYKNELGYVPADRCGRSVSQGIEFAYNDWLIVQMPEDIDQKDKPHT